MGILYKLLCKNYNKQKMGKYTVSKNMRSKTYKKSYQKYPKYKKKTRSMQNSSRRTIYRKKQGTSLNRKPGRVRFQRRLRYRS